MKITHINLFALHSVFGTQTVVPNRLKPTDAPHLRRCMTAGLIQPTGSGKNRTLTLTEAGIKALEERRARIQARA